MAAPNAMPAPSQVTDGLKVIYAWLLLEMPDEGVSLDKADRPDPRREEAEKLELAEKLVLADKVTSGVL